MAVQESTQAPPVFPANPGPSEEAVQQQLAKVLTSPQFVNSPNLCNFLQFIVEKTLAGEAATIKGYTVATQVLGRKADFDPNLDPIVRIQAGRLRRALEKYYQKQGQKDPVIIDMPKGAYVPVFRSVFRQEGEGVPGSQILERPAPALPAGPSVAVMPLLNLTGNRQQEYFTEGLAEELTSELARYQDLRVIAYQSTRRWQGKKMDARAAGQDLGVRFLVEGSIRKDARTVKIDLHAVDSQNGLRVWGNNIAGSSRLTVLLPCRKRLPSKWRPGLAVCMALSPKPCPGNPAASPPKLSRPMRPACGSTTMPPS